MRSYSSHAIVGAAIFVSLAAGLIFGYQFHPAIEKLSQPLATIVAAIIVPSIGILGYLVQKKTDHDIALKEQRRQLYIEFVDSIVYSVDGDGKRHLRVRIRAPLLASDAVAEALSGYNDYSDKTSPGSLIARDSDVFKAHLAKVLVAMRGDVFEVTEIAETDFPSLLPIK